MHRLRRPALSCLRRNVAAVCLALLALVVQIAAVTDHLALQALSAGGSRADLDQIGLLYICHRGDTSVPPDSGDGQSDDAWSPCIVCQAFKVVAHGTVPSPPAHELPSEPIRIAAEATAASDVLAELTLRYGVARGPPSFVSV